MGEEEVVMGTTMEERASGMERNDDFDLISMSHAFWPQPGVLTRSLSFAGSRWSGTMVRVPRIS